MSETLEKDYFEWLTSQIIIDGHRKVTMYTGMLELLHQKEFVWIVPNDDNRIGDSMDLRAEFLGGAHHSFQKGVSVLEVLVSLSRRMEFTVEGDARKWAGKLLENLDLHKMQDPLSKRKVELIEEILETLVWRTYDRDGVGGFFPLAWTEDDQTKVELWYQMNAYVNEMPEL